MPVVEKVYFDERKQQPVDASYYDDYWLCLLGEWGRKDEIYVGHRKLRNTKIPSSGDKVRWDYNHYLDGIAEGFFVDDNAYICEVCRSSRQACEKMIKLCDRGKHERATWKPLPEYVGSITIVADYNIPRTTLQGWEKRDKPNTCKDPRTKEKYYPKAWVEKRRKTYKRRKKSSHGN